MNYPILFDANERYNVPAIAGIAIAGRTHVNDTSENTAPFSTQGLGALSDAISCLVTEERNGPYELTMTYPITGAHFSDLTQRAIILAKPNFTDGPQPFRIYKISKPLNGVCTIYAQHISYDLSGYEMPKGLTAANLTAAVSLLSGYSGLFNIKTTKTGTQRFATDVPASVRSWLGGKEGSLLDLYGGEWHWDGYDCTLMTERGSDRGVQIRYGKNLTSLQQEEECSNLYSGVRAFFATSEGDVITGGLVKTGITLGVPRVMFLDSADQFESTPTKAQLTTYATDYIRKNNLTAPKVNLKLDFVQLQNLAERVDLCDTVLIEFEELGVSTSAKCIKTVWDVLRERYTQTQFGDVQNNFASTMAVAVDETQTQIKTTKSTLEKSIDHASALITGNSGGYVALHDTDDDGKPDEILIMDTPSINTATRIWRWNSSGLGYSDTGYDGSYGLAITADGQIVADYITTGTLNANDINIINLSASNITTGTLSGSNIRLGGLNNTYGKLTVYGSSGELETEIDSYGVRNYYNGTYIGKIGINVYSNGTQWLASDLSSDGEGFEITVQGADYPRRYRFYADTTAGFQILSNTADAYVAYIIDGGFYTNGYVAAAGDIYTVNGDVATNTGAIYTVDGHISAASGNSLIGMYPEDGCIYIGNGAEGIFIYATSNVATLQYTVVSTF